MEKKGAKIPAHAGSNPTGAMMGNEELLGIAISRAGRNFGVSVAGPDPNVPTWKRTLAKLVEDKVILEPDEGNALIKKRGDLLVYEVLNLSKSIHALKAVDERTDVACDITVLRHGVISTAGFGELFPTYGHAHEKKLGEIYSILAGNGFLLLYEPGSNATRAIRMGKGDEHYIPPGWTHRFYCGTEGVVIAGFVPHAAGHNYDAVKGKGFPYHIFYDMLRNEAVFRHNPAFGPAELQVVEAQKKPINAIGKYLNSPEELQKLLGMEK